MDYLPYDMAQLYAQKHNLRTRKQYWDWWDKHKPSFMPKRPEKVYPPNFSWNDFLNTTNSFEKTLARVKREKRTWRPFWEAVRYAQKMAKQFDLTSRPQWEAFYDEYEVPKDIPKRPGHVYDEFHSNGVGYRTWLGKDLTEKLAASRADVGIVAVRHVADQPANVIVVLVYEGGYTELIGKRDEGKAYRLYKYEAELMNKVDRILNAFSSRGSEGFIVPDMNQLLWELDNTLLIYKMPGA